MASIVEISFTLDVFASRLIDFLGQRGQDAVLASDRFA